MIFQVGIENNNEGRSIAWALEHPGCFAYGTNADGALLNLESALSKYAGWILRHETNSWLNFADSEIELNVNGSWEVYYINDNLDKTSETDGFSVESFFPYDWKPLSTIEIKRALSMLIWSRDDLLKTIKGVSPDKLNATYPGERWSILGILGHAAGAEWWYLDRLGLAFPREQLPEEPLARLEKIRSHFNSELFKLDEVKKVVGIDGEFWSPRKILRRALWHERDHTEHIRKLLSLA
ncbi:MAG TPA: DinB family protein [Anaerolineales bacterium]|nr:DinB family protein [Anaerolineales bacterium]